MQKGKGFFRLVVAVSILVFSVRLKCQKKIMKER